MREPTLELTIPASVRPDAVLHVLEDKLAVVAGEPGAADRVLLDSFDGRLRAAGLTLERAVGRTGEPWTLTLTEPGTNAESVTFTPERPDRLLATELPRGSLRDRVAPVLGERAALPTARVRSRTHALAVLNSDAKTVARIALEEPVVHSADGERIVLASRLRVTGVRGYDKQFARVRGLLVDKIGLKAAERTLGDEAALALGAAIDPGKLAITLSAGMRTDSSALAVARVLADHVEANLPGTLADLDPEFLHDLRVAIRRSRSVLRELRGAFAAEDFKRARDDLRWIQAITGPTRDLDVALAEWPETIAGLRRETVSDLGPLHALMARRRAETLATMRAELGGDRYAAAWSAWRALLQRSLRDEPEAGRPEAARAIAAVAGERIRSVYDRMLKDGRAISPDSPAQALHDLRKRGKELRYLLELFGGLWPGNRAKPLIKTLKELQDTLGRFQDRQVQAEFLRSLAPTLAAGPGGTDALIALGLVIDRLADDQHAARAEFAQRFGAFADKDTRSTVATAFGRAKP